MERDVEVVVRIPAGVRPGDVIKFSGRGLPGVNLPPGDLYVEIRQLHHPRFTRHGNDLMTEKVVSLADFLTGASFKIDVPGHGEVDVQVPKGTQPGTDVSVIGAGVKDMRNDMYGDLKARIQVRFPSQVTARGHLLMEELAHELRKRRE